MGERDRQTANAQCKESVKHSETGICQRTRKKSKKKLQLGDYQTDVLAI